MKQSDDTAAGASGASKRMIDLTPLPWWAAWYYASARAHPGWKLTFGKGGGLAVKVDPRAPDLDPLMAHWADTHRDEIARFQRELPHEWADITPDHRAIILGTA